MATLATYSTRRKQRLCLEDGKATYHTQYVNQRASGFSLLPLTKLQGRRAYYVSPAETQSPRYSRSKCCALDSPHIPYHTSATVTQQSDEGTIHSPRACLHSALCTTWAGHPGLRSSDRRGHIVVRQLLTGLVVRKMLGRKALAVQQLP